MNVFRNDRNKYLISEIVSKIKYLLKHAIIRKYPIKRKKTLQRNNFKILQEYIITLFI